MDYEQDFYRVDTSSRQRMRFYVETSRRDLRSHFQNPFTSLKWNQSQDPKESIISILEISVFLWIPSCPVRFHRAQSSVNSRLLEMRSYQRLVDFTNEISINGFMLLFMWYNFLKHLQILENVPKERQVPAYPSFLQQVFPKAVNVFLFSVSFISCFQAFLFFLIINYFYFSKLRKCITILYKLINFFFLLILDFYSSFLGIWS